VVQQQYFKSVVIVKRHRGIHPFERAYRRGPPDHVEEVRQNQIWAVVMLAKITFDDFEHTYHHTIIATPSDGIICSHFGLDILSYPQTGLHGYLRRQETEFGVGSPIAAAVP
jgi:hypothetical protein